MTERKCPKCSNSMTIVTVGETANSSFIQAAVFREKIMVDRFLCFSCGFTEEWVSAANIERAKKAFLRK